MAAQYLGIVVFIVIAAAIFFFSMAQAKKRMANVKQPAELFHMFQNAFAATRLPNEADPVCAIAFHKNVPLLVGVTNQRVLVVKHDGVLQAVPYDHAGERLGASEKNQQRRGYFRWRHQDGVGYTPAVVNGPFAGEEWLLPVSVPGFPGQQASVYQFSDRFNFAWFY